MGRFASPVAIPVTKRHFENFKDDSGALELNFKPVVGSLRPCGWCTDVRTTNITSR
jgi:hypothetical protein